AWCGPEGSGCEKAEGGRRGLCERRGPGEGLRTGTVRARAARSAFPCAGGETVPARGAARDRTRERCSLLVRESSDPAVGKGAGHVVRRDHVAGRRAAP